MSIEKLYREMKRAQASKGRLNEEAEDDNELEEDEQFSQETKMDDDDVRGQEKAPAITEESDEDDKEVVAESEEDDEDDKEVVNEEDEDEKELEESRKRIAKLKKRLKEEAESDEDDKEAVNEEDDEDKEEVNESDDEDEDDKEVVTEAKKGKKKIREEDDMNSEDDKEEVNEDENDAPLDPQDDIKEDEDSEDDEDKVIAESIKKKLKASVNVGALMEGNSLKKEHKKQIQTLFEGAIADRTKIIKGVLKEHYSKKLAKQKKLMESKVLKTLDLFCEEVAAEWMQENKLAVSRGLQMELSESLLKGIYSLFEDHNVEVPKSKENLLESAVKQIDELEKRLNKEILKRKSLQEENNTFRKASVIAEIGKDMTMTERERLSSLLEDVDYESKEAFAKKAKVLKENFLKKTSKGDAELLVEENMPEKHGEKSREMTDYLSFMKRQNKSVVTD